MSLAPEDLKALILLNRFERRRMLLDVFARGVKPAEAVEWIQGRKTLHLQREISEGDENGENCEQLISSVSDEESERLNAIIRSLNPEREIELCAKKGIRFVTW